MTPRTTEKMADAAAMPIVIVTMRIALYARSARSCRTASRTLPAARTRNAEVIRLRSAMRHRITPRQRQMMARVMIAFCHDPSEPEPANARDESRVGRVLRAHRETRAARYFLRNRVILRILF